MCYQREPRPAESSFYLRRTRSVTRQGVCIEKISQVVGLLDATVLLESFQGTFRY